MHAPGGQGYKPVFLQEGQLHLAMRSNCNNRAAISRQQLQLHSAIKKGTRVPNHGGLKT